MIRALPVPGVLLAVLALAHASGCWECNADTCPDGCCSAKGVCIVAPTSNKECGLGGVLCQDCTEQLGQACLFGECRPRCGATNCSGCCTPSGECVNANFVNAMTCGRGGEPCKVCAAGAQCQQGACCALFGGACTTAAQCCGGLSCVGSLTPTCR